MTKVFIGGSREISKLNKAIKERLDKIINNNFTIILGDANGVDKTVQIYLDEQKYEKVIVYCIENNCRNNLGNWKTKNVHSGSSKQDFNYYTQKDLEMAKDADYGFMIWDSKSKGTMNNILNLVENHKKVLLYFMPDHTFYNIINVNDIKKILEKCNEDNINVFQKKLNLNHKLIALSNTQLKLISA